MDALEISGPESIEGLMGKSVGPTEWREVTQEMINRFAELTGDHQWIHVDVERAQRESPFGGTIAHGFLTLSLLSCMAYQVCPAVEGTRTGVNYGFNRLRFVAPVRTGSRVRGRFVLQAFEVKGQRWQATHAVAVEIDGEARPAIVAEWVTAGLF